MRFKKLMKERFLNRIEVGSVGAGEGAGDTRKEWLKEENEHSWGD